MSDERSFVQLFEAQAENQREMLKKGMYDDFVNSIKYESGFDVYIEGLPVDEPKLASYHIQQLMSEIGEVLDADKRWKNFRNDKYDKNSKLEELADCFIVLMNICMFSGISAEDLEKAITDKENTIMKRIIGYSK